MFRRLKDIYISTANLNRDGSLTNVTFWTVGLVLVHRDKCGVKCVLPRSTVDTTVQARDIPDETVMRNYCYESVKRVY